MVRLYGFSLKLFMIFQLSLEEHQKQLRGVKQSGPTWRVAAKPYSTELNIYRSWCCKGHMYPLNAYRMNLVRLSGPTWQNSMVGPVSSAHDSPRCAPDVWVKISKNSKTKPGETYISHANKLTIPRKSIFKWKSICQCTKTNLQWLTYTYTHAYTFHKEHTSTRCASKLANNIQPRSSH